MMTTGLLLVQYTANGPVRAGVRHDDVVRALPRNWPGTVLAILDSWDEWSGPLRALHPHELPVVPDARLVAPVTFPRKILCAGANYYSHAEEMKTARPDPRAVPFFFMKPPTTTIAGPVASVPLPRGEAPDYDWEGELAIVIGRPGKHIAPADAASYVAGYTVADDLSARGRFQRPKAVEPFTYDWLGQKAQDGSCPIGPGIAPAWAVPDIEDQRLRLWVNGDLKQNAPISDLVVGIDGLVSAASDLVALEPGDLILTGTPAGVGLPRDTFLAAGDVVEVEIDGIGRIVHTIIAPD
jgi:2-keto-4-pentenoate hydratase/2-oxohepta-3-ene-1,7-dioic acid hydratase in catechol pathway